MTGGSMRGYAAAVIVAAGKGERFGHGGKVLAETGGRPLIAWSLDALQNAMSVRDVVIVYGPHTETDLRHLIVAGPWTNVTALVAGGSNRQESVANGIAEIAGDLKIVLIHDAARPLVDAAQFDACAEQALLHGGAILAAPVTDTLKLVEDGIIAGTVSRTGLWAAQTPQAFRLAEYREAIAAIRGREHEFTDDASIFEASGGMVSIVPGVRANIKVTHFEDLILVDLLLRAHEAAETSQGQAGGTGA